MSPRQNGWQRARWRESLRPSATACAGDAAGRWASGQPAERDQKTDTGIPVSSEGHRLKRIRHGLRLAAYRGKGVPAAAKRCGASAPTNHRHLAADISGQAHQFKTAPWKEHGRSSHGSVGVKRPGVPPNHGRTLTASLMALEGISNSTNPSTHQQHSHKAPSPEGARKAGLLRE